VIGYVKKGFIMLISQEEAIERLIQRIRESPALTDLPEEKKVEFAYQADIQLFKQGEVLTRQGEHDGRFFVVISGELHAIDQREIPHHLLNVHPAGSVVGLRSLLYGGERAATVEAGRDSVVAIYTDDDLAWLMQQDPQFEHKAKEMERAFNTRAVTDFPGRQPDEVVLAATKRHILALLAGFIWPILFLILPILFLIGTELLGLGIGDFFRDYPGIFILVTIPFGLIAILLMIYNYLDWRNDDLIVTTKRVVHIERILFYSEVRDELPLTQIQNVTIKSHSWLDTLFDCDDIDIQTMALGRVSVDRIPAAQNLLGVILSAQQLAKERGAASDRESVRRLISERLGRSSLEVPVSAIHTAHKPTKKFIKLPRVPISSFGLGYFIPRNEERKTEKGEQIVIWRKHYIVLLRNIFMPVLAILISNYLFLASIFNWWPLTGGWSDLGFWIFGLALAASLFWYVWEYDTWRRDVYILTGSKIIDIESSAFRLQGEKVREGNFDAIQNITYDLPNLIWRLFNLGDVTIQTAGTFGSFSFKQVFKPSAVQEEIFRRWDTYQQLKREKQRDETTRQVVTVLGEYHEMTRQS
jgi:hypothetical protein